MDIEVNPELLRLVATVEKDLPKVIHEALSLWLKKKIPACPLTKSYCINPNGPCNECPIPKR